MFSSVKIAACSILFFVFYIVETSRADEGIIGVNDNSLGLLPSLVRQERYDHYGGHNDHYGGGHDYHQGQYGHQYPHDSFHQQGMHGPGMGGGMMGRGPGMGSGMMGSGPGMGSGMMGAGPGMGSGMMGGGGILGSLLNPTRVLGSMIGQGRSVMDQFQKRMLPPFVHPHSQGWPQDVLQMSCPCLSPPTAFRAADPVTAYILSAPLRRKQYIL